LDVLVITYWARLIGNPKITPQDDVAEAYFVPINEVEPDKFYFNSARLAFLKLREQIK
jgi:hypothetical protein